LGKMDKNGAGDNPVPTSHEEVLET
jgi:hypothetical protein